jgi:hypothetical protein
VGQRSSRPPGWTGDWQPRQAMTTMRKIKELNKAELARIISDIQAALYLPSDDDDEDYLDPDKPWDPETLGRVAEILHNHKIAPVEKEKMG